MAGILQGSDEAFGRQLLFGLYMDPLRVDDVVELCRRAIAARQPLKLGMLNAAKVVNLRGDRLLRESLLGCDLLLADGQSVVWAGRLLGRPLPERVTGIDVFQGLLELAHAEAKSVYLLGATPEVLARLEPEIAARWPGLVIAGSRDGYFADSEFDAVAEDIRRSGADMLFIGMTSPKKEIFIGTYGSSLNVPVIHGVGGSFDVLAGITRRAPQLWQRAGMEWAFRVLQEPRRLWRRYLVTNTMFILLLAREAIAPAPPLTAAGTNESRPNGWAWLTSNKKRGYQS
jgi:N-acetylglucosaminyldiphosphoundecaprenol N-acetyl-beta-D-mannosaminyltransferase